VALAKVKDDFSRYLKLAASEEIVITRHGRPAGVLIGFESEEDWFEYRLEHHPEFLAQVRRARADLAGGHGVRLEDVQE
jgi:prevent-host-death family protein